MARVKITEKQTTNVLENDACFVVTQTPSGEEEADIRRLPLAALQALFPRSWSGSQAEYDALSSYDSSTTYYIVEASS